MLPMTLAVLSSPSRSTTVKRLSCASSTSPISGRRMPTPITPHRVKPSSARWSK
ncbi:hypothetical protein SFUMM280S_01948 [Streptomyces fumanus]